jgi:hypothetical protein
MNPWRRVLPPDVIEWRSIVHALTQAKVKVKGNFVEPGSMVR